MAFKSGVVLGTVNLNATGTANTSLGATSNSGTVAIGNASSTAVNVLGPTNINVSGASGTAIGSTSNTGTVAIGNTNSTAVTLIGPVNINTSSTNNTAINSTSNSGTVSIGNTSSGLVSIGCGTAGINVGTTANAHATTVGSTTASATTIIQAPSGGVTLTGVQGVAVANKNYVTINTSTGAIGSDAGPSGGITTIDGDSGSVTGSTVSIKGGGAAQAGSSVLFSGSGTTLSFNVTDANDNTMIGINTGTALTSGSNNTQIGGYGSRSINSGSQNCGVGAALDAVSTGSFNCAMGQSALQGVTSGNYNVAIGTNASFQLVTGSESSNIQINNEGVNGESNVLRLGAGTGTGDQQLAAAYISGIQGITVTGAAVLVSTSDQLGIAVSSAKYKDNIQDMGDASEAIYNLRPTTFSYKGSTETHYGLIAEEVDQVMPNLVVYDKSGDPQTVMYHELPALLLNEIQKLRKELTELKESMNGK